MKSSLITLGILICLALFPTVRAEDAPKKPPEVRAMTAFDSGDYATALPLLQKLAVTYAKDKEKLGPVQEKIQVCLKNLGKEVAADQPAADAKGADAKAEKEKATPEKRKPHVRPKDGEVYTVEIKELGNFEFDAEKGGNIPEDVKKLAGVKVKIRGYMIPLDQADSITEFALVPSLFACCFGQPPQVQHTLVVHTPKGKAVSYFPDEIFVEGVLKVEEKKEDGLIVSVFDIDCTSVKPTAK